MTIQELIDSLSGYYITIIVVLISIPLMSFLLVLIQKDGERNQRKLLPLYGTLIYLSCIPGIAASVLTAYSVFFIRKSLLQLSLPIYILPILSMIATLMIIKKKNRFIDIPGFHRLEGLMIMLAISFIVALTLYRTMIFIGFMGSLMNLLVIFLLSFGLLKYAKYLMKKK